MPEIVFLQVTTTTQQLYITFNTSCSSESNGLTEKSVNTVSELLNGLFSIPTTLVVVTQHIEQFLNLRIGQIVSRSIRCVEIVGFS